MLRGQHADAAPGRLGASAPGCGALPPGQQCLAEDEPCTRSAKRGERAVSEGKAPSRWLVLLLTGFLGRIKVISWGNYVSPEAITQGVALTMVK